MGWILIGIGGLLVVALLFWTKIKAWLPASTSPSVVAAIDKASDYATDAVAAGAFQTLATTGWANGDIAFLAKLDECRVMQKAWGVVVTPTTVEALAAEVANLKATLTSKTTDTIPAASAAKE